MTATRTVVGAFDIPGHGPSHILDSSLADPAQARLAEIYAVERWYPLPLHVSASWIDQALAWDGVGDRARAAHTLDVVLPSLIRLTEYAADGRLPTLATGILREAWDLADQLSDVLDWSDVDAEECAAAREWLGERTAREPLPPPLVLSGGRGRVHTAPHVALAANGPGATTSRTPHGYLDPAAIEPRVLQGLAHTDPDITISTTPQGVAVTVLLGPGVLPKDREVTELEALLVTQDGAIAAAAAMSADTVRATAILTPPAGTDRLTVGVRRAGHPDHPRLRPDEHAELMVDRCLLALWSHDRLAASVTDDRERAEHLAERRALVLHAEDALADLADPATPGRAVPENAARLRHLLIHPAPARPTLGELAAALDLD